MFVVHLPPEGHFLFSPVLRSCDRPTPACWRVHLLLRASEQQRSPLVSRSPAQKVRTSGFSFPTRGARAPAGSPDPCEGPTQRSRDPHNRTDAHLTHESKITSCLILSRMVNLDQSNKSKNKILKLNLRSRRISNSISVLYFRLKHTFEMMMKSYKMSVSESFHLTCDTTT